MTAPPQTGPDLESAARQTWTALLILDGGCHVVDANPAAITLARVGRESLLGRRFCEAFQAKHCQGETAHTCVFARALQGRERRTTPRWTTCTSEGESYTVLLSATSTVPLATATRGHRPAGAVVTMVPSVLVDEADRRRRELIATALHELRHTASVQTVAVDMLAEEQERGTLQEAGLLIDTLREATASLSTSLDDILNRTLFELDALRLHARTTELFPLLNQVAVRLAPILRRRRQEIALVVPHGLHAWLDPAAIEHALVNLLLNAHKYSVDGDTFVVGARVVRDRPLVELSVRDHGPGVPSADRRRVFERFFRGARSQDRPGAGLGLAIVYSTVERHGGSVGVRDAAGGGALFWMRLPASPPEDGQSPEVRG